MQSQMLPSAAQVPGPPERSKYESLTAQLKYEVKEADKEQGRLSDGELRAQPAKATTQLADKAFEQLEGRAALLLKQTSERKLSGINSLLILYIWNFRTRSHAEGERIPQAGRTARHGPSRCLKRRQERRQAGEGGDLPA